MRLSLYLRVADWRDISRAVPRGWPRTPVLLLDLERYFADVLMPLLVFINCAYLRALWEIRPSVIPRS